ncbi:MAG: radical SAM family heme chaperone HemW, partial [Actinomycetales bacterium]
RGESPAVGRELLSEEDRYVERVLLELRLRDGLPLSMLRSDAQGRVSRLVADGLLESDALQRDQRLVLTLRGRLLADAVVRDLLD